MGALVFAYKHVGSVYFGPLKAHSFTDSESKGVIHYPFASLYKVLNQSSFSFNPIELMSPEIALS